MAKKYFHNKIVRDNVPDNIYKAGDDCEVRTLSHSEARIELRKKLIEEASELLNAEKKELVDELADVLEVVKSIAQSENIRLPEIEKHRLLKAARAGRFKKRIFLVWSNKPAGGK